MSNRVLLALALSMGLSSMAMAAGGNSGGSNPTPPAKPTAYDLGVKAVKGGDFQGALEILRKVVAESPKNANAWNYIGYSQRRLGAFDPALAAYKKALAINPQHRGANEYLGELYLQTDNLAAAKERLKVLDGACMFGCEEFDELKEAISEYEATHKGS